MPSFRNKSRRVISAPADRVFDYLSDLDSYAKWAMSDPYTLAKTSQGPLGVGSTFLAELSVTTLGQKLHYAGVTLTVTEFVSNERIAFQMGDHEGGAWTRESCDLQPVAGGTEVTLTFEMAVPNRALALVMRPFVILGSLFVLLRGSGQLQGLKRFVESDHEMALAYRNRGVASSEEGEFKSAVLEFTRAIELDSDLASVYGDRGAAYNALGDYDRALADLSKAIELDPQAHHAYGVRASLYANLGQPGRALADLKEAIKLRPTNGNYHYTRGVLCAQMGEFERAIADLKEVLRIRSAATLKARARDKITELEGRLAAETWPRHVTADFEIDLPDGWVAWDPTRETVAVLSEDLLTWDPKLARRAEGAYTHQAGPARAFNAFDTESPPEALTTLSVARLRFPRPTTICAALSELTREPGSPIRVLSTETDLPIGEVNAGRADLITMVGAAESRQVQYVLLPEPRVLFCLNFTAEPSYYPALEPTFRQIAENFRTHPRLTIPKAEAQESTGHLVGGSTRLLEGDELLVKFEASRTHMVPFPSATGTLGVTDQRITFEPNFLLFWLRPNSIPLAEITSVKRAAMPWYHWIMWWRPAQWWSFKVGEREFRFLVFNAAGDEEFRWLAREAGWPVEDDARS